MEVRPITLNDLNAFYSLFCEVSAEGGYSARPSPPPIHATERALAQVVKNHWPVYLIEREGQVVGSAEAYPDSFCRPGGSELTGILGMQVKREYRRLLGLGSQLLSNAKQHDQPRYQTQHLHRYPELP